MINDQILNRSWKHFQKLEAMMETAKGLVLRWADTLFVKKLEVFKR
jgi:hypothetical protein